MSDMTEVTWHAHSTHEEYTFQSQVVLMHREVQPSRWTGGWADSPEKGGVYILSRPFSAAFLLELRLVLPAGCLRLVVTLLRDLSMHRTTPTPPRGTAAPTTKSYPHDVPGALSVVRDLLNFLSSRQQPECPEQRMSFCKHSGSTLGVISVSLGIPGNLWRQLES